MKDCRIKNWRLAASPANDDYFKILEKIFDVEVIRLVYETKRVIVILKDGTVISFKDLVFHDSNDEIKKWKEKRDDLRERWIL